MSELRKVPSSRREPLFAGRVSHEGPLRLLGCFYSCTINMRSWPQRNIVSLPFSCLAVAKRQLWDECYV